MACMIPEAEISKMSFVEIASETTIIQLIDDNSTND